MDEYLFCFLAVAVAQKRTGYRPGARHALMLWITARDDEEARLRIINIVEKEGWLTPELKRSMQVSDPELIDDGLLRSAAEGALVEGHAIVVYKVEMAADT